MIGLLIYFGVLVGILLFVAGIYAIVFIGCRATDRCYHSYERIDTYNDDHYIFICRKCGKIRKDRKK